VTASSFGKDLAPRVAAKPRRGPRAGHLGVKVDGRRWSYKRPMYAGNAIVNDAGHHGRAGGVSVRQSEFSPAAPLGRRVAGEAVAARTRPPPRGCSS
jgi:electron transfer flavoprotein alpha subunit